MSFIDSITANRLVNVPDEVFRRYLEFARANPDLIDLGQVLQKLTIFDFVQPIVEEYAPGDILEIGCGQGLHSCLLSRLGRVKAVELEETESWMGERVAEVRRRIFDGLADSEIEFKPLPESGVLPFDDGSVDAVFHNSVIEHVPDAVSFNRESFRVLRPGGIVICITGTAWLCWWRLLRYYLLRLPLYLALALAAETGRTAVLGRRLERVDRRVRELIPAGEDGQGAECAGLDLKALYPRLRHYLKSPGYNRSVIDRLAAETGLSPAELLHCLAAHFGSPLRRLAFGLTPETHGQHYRNAFDEAKAWRIENWIGTFTEAGFALERVSGYRYHHHYEALGLAGLDHRMFFAAAPRIHRRIARPGHRPSRASEIILVAKKPAG